MNPVTEAFRRLIPARHRVSGGWAWGFDCPYCGDTKGRASFLETPNGGFVYACKNGGCLYEVAAVWEPDDGGFFGKAQQIFELMGGSLSDIPIEILLRRSQIVQKYDREVRKFDPAVEEYVDWLAADETAVPFATTGKEIINDFEKISLPVNCTLLFDQSGPSSNNHKLACQSYVLKRGILFVRHPFLWTPRYPRHVIFPFFHKQKIIGWIGRCIDKGRQPHLKCSNFPTDYMLYQEDAYERPICLVQEGTFDAIALHSLCTFGNTISKKQVNFLNRVKTSGRKVVLLPDFQGAEWFAYWQAARENGWYIAVPQYPYSGTSGADHIKDAGESIQRNGLLLTVETIIDSITLDYHTARAILTTRSRGK